VSHLNTQKESHLVKSAASFIIEVIEKMMRYITEIFSLPAKIEKFCFAFPNIEIQSEAWVIQMRN
jgi:hypothetical protein